MKVRVYWSDGRMTTIEAEHVERTFSYTLISEPKQQVYPFAIIRHQIPYGDNVMEIVTEE